VRAEYRDILWCTLFYLVFPYGASGRTLAPVYAADIGLINLRFNKEQLSHAAFAYEPLIQFKWPPPIKS
jgi:hypothetical protein